MWRYVAVGLVCCVFVSLFCLCADALLMWSYGRINTSLRFLQVWGKRFRPVWFIFDVLQADTCHHSEQEMGAPPFPEERGQGQGRVGLRGGGSCDLHVKAYWFPPPLISLVSLHRICQGMLFTYAVYAAYQIRPLFNLTLGKLDSLCSFS